MNAENSKINIFSQDSHNVYQGYINNNFINNKFANKHGFRKKRKTNLELRSNSQP